MADQVDCLEEYQSLVNKADKLQNPNHIETVIQHSSAANHLSSLINGLNEQITAVGHEVQQDLAATFDPDNNGTTIESTNKSNEKSNDCENDQTHVPIMFEEESKEDVLLPDKPQNDQSDGLVTKDNQIDLTETKTD